MVTIPDKKCIKAIVIAGRVPWPIDDGWKLRTYNIIKGLVLLGVEIDLVVFVSDKSPLSNYQDLNNLVHSLELVPREKSYAVTDMLKGLVVSTPFTVLNYSEAGFKNRVRHLCTENSYDMLLVEDIVMAEYARSLPVPIKFLDMHNVESSLMYRYADNESSLPRKIYARITAGKLQKYEVRASRLYDSFFVCSENDRDLLHEAGVSSLPVVIPNGIDPAAYERCGDVEPGAIVFVGSMDYHANVSGIVHFVREIFPLIVARLPEVRLYIVGKNPEREVAALAAENIIVTGMVDDVRPYLSRAAVVVVPLLVGGGTRLKILEAMAMGKAVVSTTIGCEGIAARSGETIYLEDAAESFAARVVELVRDQDAAGKIGRAAREFVIEQYDWSRITAKIMETYTAAAAKRNSLTPGVAGSI